LPAQLRCLHRCTRRFLLQSTLQRIFLIILMLSAWTGAGLGGIGEAAAGTMTRDALARRFPAPYIIGEKDTALPVWPIFKKNMTSTELVAYVFESIDFAPIPGFSGVPLNLLVAVDPAGTLTDVQVLSHHEPVFLEGLGEGPLNKFVGQYKGLSLKQNLKIVTGNGAAGNREGANVYLDGVSKATASVRIINQSVLSSALKVARKKLGFAEGRDPDLIARIDEKQFAVLTPAQLQKQGLVEHVVIDNRAIDQAFADSSAARLDPESLAHPALPFIDLDVAYVSVPTVGRNLLGEAGWAKLRGRLDPGDHAVMLVSRGRYGMVGDDFVRGAVPDRLALKQGTLPIEIRDLDLDVIVNDAQGRRLKPDAFKIFRIISQSGLDPSQPLEFFLHVTRSKGIVYPEKISRDFRFSYRLPPAYFIAAQADNKTWRGIWIGRWWEIARLLGALAVLAVALTLQKRLVANDRRFIWFRRGFLTFTALFIGWYAQGQLSIVNFTGVLQALLQHRSLEFLLYDPMTVTLWAFTFVSLFIWGRGTFCGWLCPFGALQEFTGKLAQGLKLPQLKIRRQTDARLKLVKYVVLAAILASALFSAALTDKLVEIEPFKTAITLNFIRSWPFVLYAGALLVASMFVYKFFCRFLCPFGAGLAVLGRIRLLDWLPRRAECGKPCQTCRHRCEYEAIKPDGAIRYEDCFQCLDCVVIHESDDKCAPLIMEKKRARTIAIIPVSTTA
jgi:NosR/NirI family nitrous oxide reductase transcriptional regulator